MTAPTSGDRPCIESRPHSAHEWHGYPPDVWRCPGVTAPTSLAETLCRDLHPTRWEFPGRSLLPPCADCARSAEAARAWLVAQLAHVVAALTEVLTDD